MAKKLRLINNNCGGVFLVCWEREINNFCMYSVRSAQEKKKKKKIGAMSELVFGVMRV